jgi:hypothetical protein
VLGQIDLGGAGQPSGQRTPRLANACRAKAGRQISTAEARRTTGPPDAPAMTARFALRPQCAAEPTNANGETTVMRATDMDHDAAKYGSLDARPTIGVVPG